MYCFLLALFNILFIRFFRVVCSYSSFIFIILSHPIVKCIIIYLCIFLIINICVSISQVLLYKKASYMHMLFYNLLFSSNIVINIIIYFKISSHSIKVNGCIAHLDNILKLIFNCVFSYFQCFLIIIIF